MSQTYKLVQRSSNPMDKTAEKKYYALAKKTGVTNLRTLCDLIAARSAISSADVKSVLDNMNYVLNIELRAGRLVQMGELGTFRITLNSQGVADRKEFSLAMIRKARIRFNPGEILRETTNNIRFRRFDPENAAGKTFTEGTAEGETGSDYDAGEGPGDI